MMKMQVHGCVIPKRALFRGSFVVGLGNPIRDPLPDLFLEPLHPKSVEKNVNFNANHLETSPVG